MNEFMVFRIFFLILRFTFWVRDIGMMVFIWWFRIVGGDEEVRFEVRVYVLE